MARKQQDANTHLSHNRGTLLSCVAVGVVMVVAAATGLAYSMHQEAAERASIHTGQNQSTQTRPADTTQEIDTTNQEQVETMPTDQTDSSNAADSSSTSPDARNHSSSSTTITVNGETVTVNGNGSYRKRVVSDDGHTKVDIKVKNSNRQESGTN